MLVDSWTGFDTGEKAYGFKMHQILVREKNQAHDYIKMSIPKENTALQFRN